MEKQSQSVSRQFLAPLLLFIFIAWQAVYQFYQHQMAGREDSDLGSDDACSVLPGANGYSTLCMEAHLFKGWDELPRDSPTELESLLEVSPQAAKQEEASTAPQAPSSEARGLRGNGKQDSEKSRKQSAFMAKASEPKPKSKFSTKGLTELQKEVDAKMHLQARRHAEHRAMRALSVAARGESSEEASTTKRPMTPWAQGLMHDMHEMEEHMNHWREERSGHAAAFAEAFTAFAATEKQKHAAQPSNASEDLMTPWAHKLDDLTHDIEHHMEQREKEKAEHEAARKAKHDSRIAAAHANAHKAATSVDITSPLLQEIETLGAQLCRDPRRRDSAGCAHFNHDDSTAHAHHEAHIHAKADADAHKHLLEKHMDQLHKDQEHDDEEIRRQSDVFLRELCADPARKSYPTCAHLVDTTTAAPARSSNLRATAAPSPKAAAPTQKPVEYPSVLQWTPLTDSEVNVKHHHVGEPALTMDRAQLRGHHWEGKIPKIACISVLPEGKVTENLMKYFMDNYYLQNYEGSRELVLVYHNTDAEAARIAHIYADGTSIRAAPARGIDDAYPSATAYRYGAWIAKDADIVTRWDFEGFHHPNRLSMQVHAMALSKRPVSLLSGVTAFDTDGKHAVVSNTGTLHGSMMGDAAWMRKNWMPVLEEESAVLHGLHSGEVTQVAMPELLSYHDASMFRR
jgi:hypothetical protein